MSKNAGNIYRIVRAETLLVAFRFERGQEFDEPRTGSRNGLRENGGEFDFPLRMPTPCKSRLNRPRRIGGY